MLEEVGGFPRSLQVLQAQGGLDAGLLSMLTAGSDLFPIFIQGLCMTIARVEFIAALQETGGGRHRLPRRTKPLQPQPGGPGEAENARRGAAQWHHVLELDGRMMADTKREPVPVAPSGQVQRAIGHLCRRQLHFAQPRRVAQDLHDQIPARFPNSLHRRLGCRLLSRVGDRPWRPKQKRVALAPKRRPQMPRAEVPHFDATVTTAGE